MAQGTCLANVGHRIKNVNMLEFVASLLTKYYYYYIKEM